MFSSIVCTRAELLIFFQTYPCTAAFCIDGGRPSQMICHSRVVGLPHDVNARLVIVLLTCLPKAEKGSPAPPLWPNATDGEESAVRRRYTQGRMRQQTSLYCKPIDRQGDVVQSARVPLLYPCRYAREKLSVRESDRRCPPLAFSVLIK